LAPLSLLHFCCNRAGVQQQRIDDTVWRKSNEGHFKCNVDVAFFKESNRVGIGICIRDDHRRLVKAITSSSALLLDVSEGEALGIILYAIRWAKEHNFNNVVFELDSKRVVNSFHNTRNDVSDLGAIIRECRVTNSRIEFIRTQANEVARRLARAATFYASIHYFTVLPDCIQDVLINEVR
jgi:ribonuclease HI